MGTVTSSGPAVPAHSPTPGLPASSGDPKSTGEPQGTLGRSTCPLGVDRMLQPPHLCDSLTVPKRALKVNMLI